jgi:hypothetical protein
MADVIRTRVVHCECQVHVLIASLGQLGESCQVRAVWWRNDGDAEGSTKLLARWIVRFVVSILFCCLLCDTSVCLHSLLL